MGDPFAAEMGGRGRGRGGGGADTKVWLRDLRAGPAEGPAGEGAAARIESDGSRCEEEVLSSGAGRVALRSPLWTVLSDFRGRVCWMRRPLRRRSLMEMEAEAAVEEGGTAEGEGWRAWPRASLRIP